MDCQTVMDHVGLKTIHPTIPHNQSQVPLGCQISTHGTILGRNERMSPIFTHLYLYWMSN